MNNQEKELINKIKDSHIIEIREIDREEQLLQTIFSSGKRNITEKQLKIAIFITSHLTAEKYFFGTYKEIGEKCGTASQTVKTTMEEFVELGLIKAEKMPSKGSTYGKWEMSPMFQQNNKSISIVYKGEKAHGIRN